MYSFRPRNCSSCRLQCTVLATRQHELSYDAKTCGLMPGPCKKHFGQIPWEQRWDKKVFKVKTTIKWCIQSNTSAWHHLVIACLLTIVGEDMLWLVLKLRVICEVSAWRKVICVWLNQQSLSTELLSTTDCRVLFGERYANSRDQRIRNLGTGYASCYNINILQ